MTWTQKSVTSKTVPYSLHSQASPDTPRLPYLSRPIVWHQLSCRQVPEQEEYGPGTGRELFCAWKNFVGSIHCLKQVVEKSSNDRKRQVFCCLPDFFLPFHKLIIVTIFVTINIIQSYNMLEGGMFSHSKILLVHNKSRTRERLWI